MATIKAQKVPKKVVTSDEILARFCYLFQQYTFAEARELPYKRIVQMLKAADREKASFLYDLTQSISAPYSKGGRHVAKMLEYFKSRIEA